MTAEKIMFTESELQALEAYGSNWVYDSHGQFIKSASLVADNLLRLRGWGHLTGGGALNLSKEEAEKLQDALGSLITKLPQMVAYIQAAQGNQVSELKNALFDMVWQFCSNGDKLAYSFMSAEELAFSVLGLENGMTYEEAFAAIQGGGK